MIPDELDTAIKAVCPIQGVSIGKVGDKLTWEIQFSPEATDTQKQAAQAVVTAFVPKPLPDLSDPANQQKAILALALCIAQVGSLTVPQMKTMFKAKWDSLP